MKSLDGIKPKTKKGGSKKTKAPKKKPVIQKKPKKELSEPSKKALMWILVGIFTVIFVLLAFFSIKAQFNSETEDNSGFFETFFDVTNIASNIKDEFTDAANKLFNEEATDEETEVSDEQIQEWEEKLFPEFTN